MNIINKLFNKEDHKFICSQDVAQQFINVYNHIYGDHFMTSEGFAIITKENEELGNV